MLRSIGLPELAVTRVAAIPVLPALVSVTDSKEIFDICR
jgi:hypothetical protein